MSVNGIIQARVVEFCASKRIAVEGLVALGTRVDTTTPGDVRLAWAYPAFRAGRHIISAVKFREVGTGRRAAMTPSVFLKPLVIGNGESSGRVHCRGRDGRLSAVRPRRRRRPGHVPPRRSEDVQEDVGRLPAARSDRTPSARRRRCRRRGRGRTTRRILGGGVRVRPPDGYKDWCQWPGSRDEFIQIVAAARKQQDTLYVTEPWSTFRDETAEQQRYLVDDIHPEAAVVFLAAEPKAGKTWKALARNVCLATGASYCGHEIPQRVPSLYIGLEGMRTAIRARVGCLARGVGVDPDGRGLDLLHILYRPKGFDLGSEETAQWVCAHVAELGAKLVTFDTLRSAASVRESNEGATDISRLLRLLSPLTSSGVSVEFLHHYVKLTETRQQRAAADRMSGSGALRGHLDVGVFITRYEPTERRMRVEYELRDGVALDPVGLRLDGVGTGPYGGFTYHDTVRLVVEDKIIGEQQPKAPSGEIAAWIREQPRGRATPSEICAEFDISQPTLRRRRPQICSWGIEYTDAGRFSRYQAAEEHP